MPNHLQDGFSTVFNFSLVPAISLWERRVKPPAIDGGGPIEEATMYSESWRVRSPKSLATLTEMTATCAYRVQAYSEFFVNMQQIGIMTVTFPDGSTLVFHAWLDKFDPQELVEGESPNVVITIFPSMQDALYAETDFSVT